MATFGGVAFTILEEDAEGVGGADWEEEDHTTTVPIPTGSDVTFAMGVGSGVKTHRLLFADQTDWDAFKALRQTTATLVDWNEDEIEDVFLQKITAPFTLIDDRQLCTATFRRSTGS